MNPLVSIIIPCYKSEKHIRQCVNSIIAQTFTDWEAIFVVDDATLDNTTNILGSVQVRGWSERNDTPFLDQRIRIITRPTKSSPAAARNSGVKYATGEYITFLDADDWWYPEKLQKQLGMMLTNPDAQWCWAYATMHSGVKEFMMEKLWDNPDPDTMIPFQTFMLHRNLVNKIISEDGSLLDESLSQIDDYDLFLRLKKYPSVCLREPLAHYRIHGGGLTTSTSRLNVAKIQLGININRRQWQNLPRMLRLYTEFKMRSLLLPYKNQFDTWQEKRRLILQIEPTTRCNLHCVNCSRGYDTPFVDITKETLLELVQKYHPHTIILQGIGEPFMHPDFERVCYIAKQNCTKLITITNGTIINTNALKHLDHVVVSLDTLDENEAKYTRGYNYNLQRVLENIRTLAKNDSSTVDINYVRMAFNFKQQKPLQEFCDELNIPLHVTPIQNWHNPEEPEWGLAHDNVIEDRWISGDKVKLFKPHCPFLDGRKMYFDARGVQHPCCIRMRYDQVQPTARMCESCPL